jgi:ribonuclease BN (tRNA processing enzyme)
VELVVLGSGGGWARPGGAACGYLVRHQGFNLWVDAGTGTMANLQQHVGLLEVDAVAISHRHFDHFLDLYPFFLALLFDPERSRKLPLFAPPGMVEHALKLEAELTRVFEPRVVEPGHAFEAGPLRVRTALMRHPVPTMGMRLEADGRSLAYSGDTGPTDELEELARGADVLLAEATWVQRAEGWEYIHMTAEEAGQSGRRADVGRLVLTHIWPTNDRSAVEERAAAAFGGPIILAEEGLAVDLSATGEGAR